MSEKLFTAEDVKKAYRNGYKHGLRIQKPEEEEVRCDCCEHCSDDYCEDDEEEYEETKLEYANRLIDRAAVILDEIIGFNGWAVYIGEYSDTPNVRIDLKGLFYRAAKSLEGDPLEADY